MQQDYSRVTNEVERDLKLEQEPIDSDDVPHSHGPRGDFRGGEEHDRSEAQGKDEGLPHIQQTNGVPEATRARVCMKD